MLRKTDLHFNIEPIIRQVTELDWAERSILLNETTGQLLNGPYTTKQEFQNTPLGEVLESLGEIGEARLLKLEPAEVYSAHTDPDDRYHLSIITNPHCYLANLEDNTLHHLPLDGYVWDMDTSIKHSAVNLGGLPRIHLNVRKRLPNVTDSYYRLTVVGENINWRQEVYFEAMGYVNRKIKTGEVTGLEKINDREMLISFTNPAVLRFIVNSVQSKGFELKVTPETR